MTGRHDAGELSRMLAAHAPVIAAELLPAGRREGAEWKCGSTAGERGRSLSVRLTGSRAGVWSDFASGERGDLLDLAAATLFAGDLGAALRWARAWLGLSSDGPAPTAQRRPAPPPADAADIDAEAVQNRDAALRMFLAAAPAIAGTPAGDYLAGRGIDLAELGRQPRALRFHPALWNSESGRRWPAMVAAISGAEGTHVATHRTWLAPDPVSGRWGKAPLVDAKRTLGRYAGGSIRLWRGASGAALAKAPAGETVAIAEGIETGLSVAIACPHLRVLAAVSLANMSRLELPAAIATVVVAADHDTNDSAKRALQAAVDRFAAEGRTVRVAMPETPGADWNDVLLHDAEVA